MAHIYHGVPLILESGMVRFSELCFFYLYKQSNWKSSIKPKIFCRRKFFVFNNKWSKCTAQKRFENLNKITEKPSSGKWVSILAHLNKRKKFFLLIKSKRLYIHQFSLITNKFNRFYHKNTWTYMRYIFNVWWTHQSIRI